MYVTIQRAVGVSLPHTDLAGTSGIRNILYYALAWATWSTVTGAELYRMSIRNVTFRERTPEPHPRVLSPPTPASAPSSPLATAPGCLVPVNTAVEAPLALPAVRLALRAASRNTGGLGQGHRLQTWCPVLSGLAVGICVCCLKP